MPDLAVGPVVTPIDVEIAVRDTLRDTLAFYLAEVDEQHDLDRGTTTPPRGIVARSENARWAEETPPFGVVACPGTVGEPELHGQYGSYGAWFQVNIGITVGGATEDGTRDLASRHLAAVMLVIGQQRDMGGLADDARWKGGTIDEIPPQRTLIGCEAIAHIHIARVLDTRGLIPRDLPTPRTDPADPAPTPESVRVRTIST